MIIIGLGNRARHGKDTAAEAIIAHANKILYPTLKYSWALPLREETNAFLLTDLGKHWMSGGTSHVEDGGSVYAIPDWVTPTPNAEPVSGMPFGKHSKLLQWWGTDYRRHYSGWDYWVNKGKTAIGDWGRKHPNGIVLVPDTRFNNELQAIEDVNGITIQCNRRNEDGAPFRDPARDANHPSETELDNANWQHKIVSKHAALTAEIAITIFEFERGLRGF
jgi:hypothetical protein